MEQHPVNHRNVGPGTIVHQWIQWSKETKYTGQRAVVIVIIIISICRWNSKIVDLSKTNDEAQTIAKALM
jgi:hypothetical protein